jgi:hypothetical protein
VNIYFLNYHRAGWDVHASDAPMVLFGEGDADTPAMTPRTLDDLATAVAGRDVLFVTHGFNVTYVAGLRSLGRFAARLKLGGNAAVIGVLWPGDFRVPFTTTAAIGLNYPLASTGAIEAGQRLGDLCSRRLGGARSFSFLSHSLGARVVLEAVKNLGVKARLLCITAGAVNDDCLTGQYVAAAEQALTTRTLASTMDWVLQVLFRVGDPVSQFLGELTRHLGTSDHALDAMALGRLGPHPLPPGTVYASQIAEANSYGHGNYMAPSVQGYAVPAPGAPPGDSEKWFEVADFVSAAFAGNAPAWPQAWTPPKSFRPWYWPFGS